MKGILAPDSFARALALAPHDGGRMSKEARSQLLANIYAGVSDLPSEDAYDVYRHFAACYLPTLVRKWREGGPDAYINSSRADVLGILSVAPFFKRFLISGHPESKGITLLQAERICEAEWRRPDSMLRLPDACQFLSALIMWDNVDMPLSSGVVDRLCPKLEFWIKKYDAETAAQLLGVLRKEIPATSVERAIRDLFIRADLSCSLPECPATSTPDTPWVRCAKCTMVRYCSVDHMVLHWPKHKETCCLPVWLPKAKPDTVVVVAVPPLSERKVFNLGESILREQVLVACLAELLHADGIFVNLSIVVISVVYYCMFET